MDQPPDESRHPVEEYSSFLAEERGPLEREAKDTVHGVTATVGEAVEALRDVAASASKAAGEMAHDAAESVRHAFDLKRQAAEHPWALVVGAVVMGYVLGRLVLPCPARPPRGYRKPDAPQPKLGQALKADGQADAAHVTRGKKD